MKLSKFSCAMLLTVMLSSCSGIKGAPSRQTNGYLYADLSFTMFCEKSQYAQVEQKIETFLREEGFRVLNYELIQHEKLLDMRLDGIDQSKHVVEFHHVTELHLPPDLPRRYGVLLWTEPLTPRAIGLEAKLVRFANKELKCEVRFVERRENGAPSVDLFNHKVNEIEEGLQLANEMDKKSHTTISPEKISDLEEQLTGLWLEVSPSSRLIQFFPDHNFKLYLTKEEGSAKKIHSIDGSWSLSDDGALALKVISGERWTTRLTTLSFKNGEMLLTEGTQETKRLSRHIRVIGLPAEYSW